MKYSLLLVFILFISHLNAQSKKEARENNLRSTVSVDIEDGKTLKNKTTFFDKKGQTVEETDYDKEGNLKPELSTDGLHLNQQGYLVWSSGLKLFNQLYLE